MKNIRLLIAYDGTCFLGWQKTPLGPSIEESLQCILEQILQEPVVLQAASRTDAGVHADGQVVNFFTQKTILSLEKLQKSLNALLPKSITVLEMQEMPLSFHPTLDNVGKEYQYFICNTPYQQPKYRFTSWHVPSPLSLENMRSVVPYFLGLQDFSAFCNTDGLESDKNPLCTLYSITLNPLPEERLCFSVIGNRFLFRMMRILVGTLIYVGKGRISTIETKKILPSKKRCLAGVTAPAHGLHLAEIFYKEKTLF